MRKKFLAAMTVTAAMTAALGITAFAAGWQQNVTGWWYGTNADNTQWYANGWQWIDGNGDGIAECYYFDENGYMLAGTTTPDGYTVDASGAWVDDGGTVQTKSVSADTGAQMQQSGGTVSLSDLYGKVFYNSDDDTSLELEYDTENGGGLVCYYRYPYEGFEDSSRAMYERMPVYMKQASDTVLEGTSWDGFTVTIINSTTLKLEQPVSGSVETGMYYSES